MKYKGKTFTIGADPEIFVGQDNKFICAAGLIPGDKENPHPVKDGAVQVDGMALEFNIDPAEDYEQFQHNLDSVRDQLGQMIPDKHFLETCSVEFSQDFLENVPMEALLIGCDPDYNAYSYDENEKPNPEDLMRTAGGHVHVGGIYEEGMSWNERFFQCATLARILDKTLGAYSVLWDKDDKRRTMYGKAGSFRMKNYGMEYRSLSNSWIFNKDITKFVFDSVEEAIHHLVDGNHEVDDVYREIIDNSDRNHFFFDQNVKANRIKAIVGA